MSATNIAEKAVYFLAAILGGFLACEVYAQVSQHASALNTYAETVAALVM